MCMTSNRGRSALVAACGVGPRGTFGPWTLAVNILFSGFPVRRGGCHWERSALADGAVQGFQKICDLIKP